MVRFILPKDFTIEEAADAFRTLRVMGAAAPALEEIEFRFLPRGTHVPAAAGTLAIGLTEPSVIDECFVETAVANGVDPPAIRLLSMIAADRLADGRAISRRLPDYIRGRLVGIAPDADRVRRETLEDSLALMGTASRMLASGKGGDVLHLPTLLRRHRLSCADAERGRAEAARIGTAAKTAFFALRQEANRYALARRDLAHAETQIASLLGASARVGGNVHFHTRQGKTVLVVRSDADRLISLARSERGADVVIQLAKRARRIRVVTRPNTDGTGLGLAHAAAMLRNADAALRLGRLPDPDPRICYAGRTGTGGLPAVFSLSPAENVVENMDPGAPPSALRERDLLACTLLAIKIEESPAAALAGAGTTASAEGLAAAMMPHFLEGLHR